ncbi:MAG: outer membrane protein assembly factor BamC [Gammaproteobacteria bacterium]|nr:outer membrane protein assembly factor BamC [Gammaproteobacteria bacterium]NVK87818.1 outer membrane protein assembly factor BamC [Gammaproteobacteria bacterium]
MKLLSVVVLAVSFTLSGCSWLYGENALIHDSSNDYKKTQQTPPLKMPEGLNNAAIQDELVVPPISNQQGSTQDLTKPPLQLLSVGQGMRQNRAAQTPSIFWMTSEANAHQALKDYFAHEEIEFKELASGIETGWINESNEAWWRSLFGTDLPRFVRSRFQINIGPGQQLGEVAVTVKALGLESQPYDEEKWVVMEPTERSSTEFLNSFIGYVDYLDRLGEAKRLRELNQGFSVTLGQNESRNAALVAEAKYEVVWLKTPEVLAPFGFTLNDKDISRSTYFFEFEANSPGFFASLIGDDEGVVLELPKGPYQVIIGGKNSGPVTISFIGSDGEPLSDARMAQVFPHLAEAFGRKTRTRKK